MIVQWQQRVAAINRVFHPHDDFPFIVIRLVAADRYDRTSNLLGPSIFEYRLQSKPYVSTDPECSLKLNPANYQDVRIAFDAHHWLPRLDAFSNVLEYRCHQS